MKTMEPEPTFSGSQGLIFHWQAIGLGLNHLQMPSALRSLFKDDQTAVCHCVKIQDSLEEPNMLPGLISTMN